MPAAARGPWLAPSPPGDPSRLRERRTFPERQDAWSELAPPALGRARLARAITAVEAVVRPPDRDGLPPNP